MARRRMVFRAVCGADRRKEEGEVAVCVDGVWQLLLFRTAGWCRLVLRRGWRRVTSPQVRRERLLEMCSDRSRA